MLYVYLDETNFGDNNEFFGYGSLISHEEISQSIVDEAVENLRQDPDTQKDEFIRQDSRTLQRGWFHASEDSQNAHSHICNGINKNIVGTFHAQYFDLSRSEINQPDVAYQISSKLSILNIFSETKSVVLIFERRGGLNETTITKWLESLWKETMATSYLYPWIPTFYPKLSFRICYKSEPGLQVVDFMLWAAGRKKLNFGCEWFDHIDSKVS
jgi:uncharacterized protein DUF3800